MKSIELGIKQTGVGKQLSNFFHYPFVLDDMPCTSMETFIQSLKFKDLESQVMIATCEKSWDAYKAGQEAGNDWKTDQMVYWQEEPIARNSTKYFQLMIRAYDACYDQNPALKQALLDSEFALLTHYIGKTDQTDTLLTQAEYLFNMYRLRSKAFQELSED